MGWGEIILLFHAITYSYVPLSQCCAVVLLYPWPLLPLCVSCYYALKYLNWKFVILWSLNTPVPWFRIEIRFHWFRSNINGRNRIEKKVLWSKGQAFLIDGRCLNLICYLGPKLIDLLPPYCQCVFNMIWTSVSTPFIYVDMKSSAVRSVYVPYLLFFPCSFFHLFQTMKIIIEIYWLLLS